MSFGYDWEAVLMPVIDVLAAWPDVDGAALTGNGVSRGRYWITPAVAFVRRMVAAVADPGVDDMSRGGPCTCPRRHWTALRDRDRTLRRGVDPPHGGSLVGPAFVGFQI